MQIVGGEDARVGHNAADQVGRGDVEAGIVALHAVAGGLDAHGLEHEVGIAHLDVDGVHGGMALVRRAGDEVGHAHVLRHDGDLEGADLVDHMAVQADRVRSGGEHVDLLLLHHEGGHVVGDDGHVEAHVVADGGGQARTLEVGAGLGAEQADVLALLLGHLQHLADDGLAEALGHDRAVAGEHVHQIVRHLLDLVVAQVVGLHGVVHDGLGHVAALQDGLLCRGEAALGDQLHALHGGGTRVGDRPGGLLQIGDLLLGAHVPALVGGQRHAHGGGGVGACALGHHVGDGLGDLLMGAAGDELHLARIHAAVEYAHLAGIVPGDVFILQHECKALVCSLHYFASPYSRFTAALALFITVSGSRVRNLPSS